jgi:hypothetical protein
LEDMVGRVMCACLSEEHTDREGPGLEEVSRLSYTRKYISLTTDSVRGWGFRFR